MSNPKDEVKAEIYCLYLYKGIEDYLCIDTALGPSGKIKLLEAAKTMNDFFERNYIQLEAEVEGPILELLGE